MEPTTTRKILRRAIAKELQMPFFRRFEDGESTIDAGSTTTLIIDSALRQPDTFWNGGWFFDVDSGRVSLIRNYLFTPSSFSLETALTLTPDVGDKYEIHSVWNALELHDAINRAINMSSRTFPETVVDETLIHQEDTLAYTISSLAKRPFQLNKVWIENPSTISRGTATAGGASSITVMEVPSDIDTGWKISIYSGTGAGQIKNYASRVGLVVTVNTAWTTQPDSTSKYAMWDANLQRYDWVPMHMVYTDAKEFPDALRFRRTFTGHYGMRIRVEYLALPTELVTDADTTVVPKEFVVPKACAILHGQKLKDTRADRDMHFAENQRYNEQAETFLVRNAPHTPDTQIKSQWIGYMGTDKADPLNWRGY